MVISSRPSPTPSWGGCVWLQSWLLPGCAAALLAKAAQRVPAGEGTRGSSCCSTHKVNSQRGPGKFGVPDPERGVPPCLVSLASQPLSPHLQNGHAQDTQWGGPSAQHLEPPRLCQLPQALAPGVSETGLVGTAVNATSCPLLWADT